MVICIEQWRERIGLFVARSTKGKFTAHDDLNIVNYNTFVLIMLLLDLNEKHYFSCCHWNANSIMAQKKLSLLSAYKTPHKYNEICISETYLDKSADNDALSIDGYNIIRVVTHITRRELLCVFV